MLLPTHFALFVADYVVPPLNSQVPCRRSLFDSIARLGCALHWPLPISLSRPSLPQICPGDILVSIDGSKAIGLTNSQIVRLVRGTAGTQVALGFRRPLAPPGDPSQIYIVNLVRGHEGPVSQRAFGSSDASPVASRTSRTFLVL